MDESGTKRRVYPGMPREAVRARASALARHEAWAQARLCTLLPSDSIACVAFLYDLLPEETRTAPVDASGVMVMQRILAAGFARR